MKRMMPRLRRRFAERVLGLGLAAAACPLTVGAQDYFGIEVADEGGGRASAPWRGGRHSGPLPSHHVVHRGDTLWDITGYYFGNPWDWPRVWAVNPEIANPHWIYPNDHVRLAGEGDASATGSSPSSHPALRPGRDSVRGRNEGYIDPDALDNDGHIVGSPTEHMMLAPGDEIWVRYEEEDAQPERGRELTIFREIPERDRRDHAGDLVRILGTAVVRSFDADRGLVRAEITEATEPIERGFHVAQVPREQLDVPPVPNDRDMETQVAATLHPRDMISDNTYVFIELGSEDGIRVGNRFFVVRHNDPYFDSVRAMRGESASEGMRGPEDDVEFPTEIIGEVRVVSVRDHSATLAVTQSVQEIRVGDTLQMRRGF